MNPATLTLYALVTIAGTIAIAACVRWIWLGLGAWKIHRAGPRPLSAAQHTIWTDPGVVEELDLAAGPGGADEAPVPPFTFVEEHLTGSQPCVSVRDARGRR